MRSAQQARLSGSVSIGLAPTTSAVLGLPLMRAMRDRYPDVRLHMVEGMSGHLAAMLRARELDVAVLFGYRPDSLQLRQPADGAGRDWQVELLVEEELFLIRGIAAPALPPAVTLADLGQEPLILPTGPHGLRSTLDAAFARAGFTPVVALEVDSLAMVMAAVDAGLGSTLQPWAAMGRYADAAQRFRHARLDDLVAKRINLMCSARCGARLCAGSRHRWRLDRHRNLELAGAARGWPSRSSIPPCRRGPARSLPVSLQCLFGWSRWRDSPAMK